MVPWTPAKARQRLALAEDFLDHDVERLRRVALRLADQAAQPLEILRGIAQAVDVVEPQALQPVRPRSAA